MTWRAAAPILCTILLAGTAAVFIPARNFAFLNWDDIDEVTENPLLHPPAADQLRQIWSGPYLELYAPLTYTAWWSLARMGAGDNPYAFHLLNVLLHLACVGLVFSILRLCVKSPAAAFGGAVIFALHPMQVETVGWVAEMNNLLAAALSLAAIRLYLASGATHPRRRWIIYGLGSAAYLAALFSKPTAVVVPLIAIILDWGVFRRPLRPAVYALLPWLAAAGVFGWIAHRSQSGIAMAMLDRPIVALDALGFYCRKFFWPVGLTADYGRTPGRVLPGPGWIANAGIAVALGILLWLLRRKYRGAALGALIALAALLPVLGLVPFEFQELSTVADHFMYLAMLGPALAVAAVLDGLPGRAALPAAVAAGLMLAWLSIAQLQIWQNSKTLVEHTLAIDPGSAVGNSLAGSELTHEGRSAQAVAYYFRSLARNPRNPNVQYNLANDLASLGQYDQAIEHFQIAVALFDPPSRGWRAINNLGILYATHGQRDLAAAQFKRVLEIDPHNPQAMQNLRKLTAGATTR
ncbi:MAG: tetratricopeptide repeat protein [Tepidisphaeraceae bacterium]|jgi:tetratricopeptide (TPR) repeat protein